MIPLQLTLKNFLSYRDATLDFRGLHTACICGANGAGKSSLLEAITWAVWGQSRAATEDDVINTGAKDVRVDFTFINNNQVYKIIRSRTRGRSAALEFQVESGGGFRSISGKGVKDTQEQILGQIRLDYDTFINSAYLRQGRADEFMSRRPNERKQILADLLKLSQYEELAEKAKDLSKQYKGQAEELEQSLQVLVQQLQEKEDLIEERTSLDAELEQLQKLHDRDLVRLQELQLVANEIKTWEQQLSWHQDRYRHHTQDCDRLTKDCLSLQGRLSELEKFLAQETEIVAGYQRLQSLQAQEASLSDKFQAYQDAQQQKQQRQQQLTEKINQVNLEIKQTQTHLEALEQQELEIEEVLSHSDEVAAALEKLSHHRRNLQKLDEVQLQVAPLLQQRNRIENEINQARATLNARLEQLHSSERELQLEASEVPGMKSKVVAVDLQIGELDKKRVYQQRVLEKGQERGKFQERLQENQRVYEKQLGELQQKLEMLQTPGAVCPLCDRPLDEHYRNHVINKTQTQQDEIQQQFWAIREQMAVCERELQVLRAEYAKLSKELAGYDSLQQQLGQLEAQLDSKIGLRERLQQIVTQKEEIERSLNLGSYALDLQAKLASLDRRLAELNYDEQTHALVRGEVNNWRWAEIRQAKLDDAQKRLAALQAQKPQLKQRIEGLENAIAQLRQSSEIQQEIERLDRYLAELGYNRQTHNQIIEQCRQAQAWELPYQKLAQSKQDYPKLAADLQQLEQMLQVRLADKENMKLELDNLVAQRQEMQDVRPEISCLEEQISQKRQQLDRAIAQQGRLEQALIQIETLEQQYAQSQQRLQAVRKQYRVYQELAIAFGKKGIQALMIENILPQLEAQTNQILARLTGNQLHVQFITQKVGRSSRSKKKAKTIDTLEILIADARGTRPYETYSGGESFRINFAIRLALARLLAQRAGTALQMLIVDEGFGTQDAEGCERLIAAINAIAADFQCILTVTHMPQFKEAFQTRVEVYKTQAGSQLKLLN
ncbi:exonuclease subunit SbcC [Oscillatoria salina]|uniref:exonuclease subunit SbcC n=1 Tax=Oscillatoria salina TaxID=331517 RepID=UPI001CCCE49B|nr:exonuclease subunit SbcC [Oscillatoria salina]MBZ8180371.1 exonuclease subunit SbcC [Oscillatoria salina IIICB1]